MRSPDQPDLPGTELLRLARASIEHGLARGEPLPVNHDELPGVLAEPAATFTTLRKEGRLRGCCGTLEAVHPLAVDVAGSAFQAAFRDSRFPPVVRDEFESISLEVSVLSPLEKISIADEPDLLNRLIPGSDGLVLVAGSRRATFLPKVWEMFPEPDRFVSALKRKCGLPDDYWSEQLQVFRYKTASFGEAG